MGRIRPDQRFTALVLAATAVAVVILSANDLNVVSAVVLPAMVLFVWWSWPGRVGGHTPHQQAQAEAGPEDVLVYWRPG